MATQIAYYGNAIELDRALSAKFVKQNISFVRSVLERSTVLYAYEFVDGYLYLFAERIEVLISSDIDAEKMVAKAIEQWLQTPTPGLLAVKWEE